MSTPAPADNVILAFMLRYQNDWVGLVRNVLKAEPDEWQAEALTAVQNGERRVSIRSGHGVGKTALESWICVCALLTCPLVKIIITAPSGPQLYDALFSEIKMWLKMAPEALVALFTIGADRIEASAAPELVFLSARTSRAETPEAMQGVHADGGRVILMADEASGIPEAVYEAGAGSMSGANCTTILAGNPTRRSGFFYDTHNILKDMWHAIHVSCLTSSRVTPDFITDMAARYGEASNAYRVRVLGEFPLSDDDTYISAELVEAAQMRDIVSDVSVKPVWGVDVARFGNDDSTLVKRRGNCVNEKPRRYRKYNTMQLVGAIKHEFDCASEQDKPSVIMVDVIGIGAGVVDRCLELNLPVRGINVAESPAFDPNGQYYRLRDELWGKGKAWIESRACYLCPSTDWLELSTPRFKFMSNGQLKIESKEEMRNRRVHSPDVADGLLLTMAADAGIAAGSTSGYRIVPAGKHLRRNLKGVI